MMYRLVRRSVRPLSPLTVLLLILLLYVGAAAAVVAPGDGDFQGCPMQGQGGDPDLYRLKNRSAQVSTTEPMTVAQINALSQPLEVLHGTRATWPASTVAEVSALEQKGVVVEGFLIGAKQSGTETTNCQRKNLRDYHLWIVDAKDQTRAQAVVAEVTPRWLVSNHGWHLHTLGRLAQQRARVRLTGWLMLDPEHPDHSSGWSRRYST
jgi:hypothetical protein